jgi:uncharacterized protein (TIGR02996 family)
MHEEQGFLRQLREHPDDNVTRMAYTDWLEERGDPRGEYLRLEAALTRVGNSGPERDHLEAEVTRRANRLDAGWLEGAGWRFDLVLLGGDRVGRMPLLYFSKGRQQPHLGGWRVGVKLVAGLPGILRLEDTWLETARARKEWPELDLAMLGPRCRIVIEPSISESRGYQTCLIAEDLAAPGKTMLSEQEAKWINWYRRLGQVVGRSLEDLRTARGNNSCLFLQTGASLAETWAAVRASSPRVKMSVHRAAPG